MRSLLIVIMLIPFSACRQGAVKQTVYFDSSKKDTLYREILEGLRSDGSYMQFELDQRAGRHEVNQKELDSTLQVIGAINKRYQKARAEFFSQDSRFIHWLLQFRKDTVHSGLWPVSKSPLSSTIDECDMGMNNSRATINLIMNYLDDNGFICYPCDRDDPGCNEWQYNLVNRFISRFGDLPLPELRKRWKEEVNPMDGKP
jgi:hypothetical protein